MTQPDGSVRKVVIAPQFGGGWSTWQHHGRDAENMCLFDEALIADIEANGGRVTAEGLGDFKRRYEERFGEEPFTPLDADLTVVKVNGLFRVHEYDGAESIVYARDDSEEYR